MISSFPPKFVSHVLTRYKVFRQRSNQSKQRCLTEHCVVKVITLRQFSYAPFAAKGIISRSDDTAQPVLDVIGEGLLVGST